MMAPVCSGSAADEAVFWRERAGSLAAENVRLAAENTTLAGTVAVQREQIAALKQRVVTLSRMLFGTSSEKGDPGRPEAGGGDGDGPGGGGDGRGDGGGAGEGRRGQRPGSAGHGRRRHDHLDAEEQVHDVPEGERRCPRCGRAYELFGEDASEQVSWRVRVWRIVHRRRKYARSCRCPVPAVVTAPGPAKLTGRGLFTTEFCVNLLVAKYALGLPFNRVIAMLSFQGLEVAPGTLAGVARRLDILLAPLAGAIAARNAASGHAHVDETSWRVFGQPADCGGDRWWLWVFTGPDTVVYQIAPSRSLKVLEGHYGVTGGQLPEGRGPLVISSDFYSVYRSFSELDGVTPLWCFAHIRRRFIRAGDAHRKELGARTLVACRKNYSGSGARLAADLAGRAWTILGTARIAGHNPRAYLSIYLEACAANGGKPPTGQPCCHGTSPCPASPPRQGTRPAGHRDRRRHPAPRRPGPLLRPGLHPRRAGGHRPARGDAAQPRRDLPRRLRRPRLARLRRAAQGHDRPRRPEQDGRRHPDHPAAPASRQRQRPPRPPRGRRRPARPAAAALPRRHPGRSRPGHHQRRRRPRRLPPVEPADPRPPLPRLHPAGRRPDPLPRRRPRGRPDRRARLRRQRLEMRPARHLHRLGPRHPQRQPEPDLRQRPVPHPPRRGGPEPRLLAARRRHPPAARRLARPLRLRPRPG